MRTLFIYIYNILVHLTKLEKLNISNLFFVLIFKITAYTE